MLPAKGAADGVDADTAQRPGSVNVSSVDNVREDDLVFGYSRREALADRLSRDLIVFEMAVRAFAEAGVSIVTADTGQSLTYADNDPSRKLIRQVLNAVAEYERSALVGKLRAARDRKRRNGGHSVGCYRFGAHPDRPHEAETLARVLELRKSRRDRRRPSLSDIAELLNQEARTSRTGRPCTQAMVRDLVRSATT